MVLTTDKEFLQFVICWIVQLLKNFNLLCPNRILGKGSWFIHGKQRQKLKGMVLHHISKGPRVIIVATAFFNPQAFSKSNLDIVNKISVPKVIKNKISKTNGKDILDHFFSKVMVDPEDLFFIKGFFQFLVELTSCFQVCTERFFNDQALKALPIHNAF